MFAKALALFALASLAVAAPLEEHPSVLERRACPSHAGDAQMLLQGGCGPSVIQQTIGSNYLKAHNRRGGQALVPTLSVYTVTDNIIQPEIIDPTSDLPGATVASVQELCGLLKVDDHFTMTVSAPAFHFIADTIQHGGIPDRSRFKLSWCTYVTDGIQDPDFFEQTAGLVRQTFFDAITLLNNVPRTRSEPTIKAYAQ